MGKFRPKIMYESKDAASIKTVTGWVSSSGRFWADDEHMARYDGSTHKICECGGETENSYIRCRACRDRASSERYNKLPFEKYEGQIVWSNSCGEYFFEESAIRDYAHWEGIEDLNSLELIVCDPQYIKPLYDYDTLFEDILPDDLYLRDVAPKIADKFDELNELIKSEDKIASWYSGKTRTALSKASPQDGDT